MPYCSRWKPNAMGETRIGSLFSGVGGLDIAVESVFGGQIAWHCENDLSACVVLRRYWPDIPNLGNIKAVDWFNVKSVDVLCGGFPCQDVSSAGMRNGMIIGSRSGLWNKFAIAINVLRPSTVVIENVLGLLSAKSSTPRMKAIDVVLRDLTTLGYGSRRMVLPASAVGAPHRRNRVFIVAKHDAIPRHRNYRWINHQDDIPLLPTPSASDGLRGSRTYKRGNPTLRGAVLDPVGWIKYQPAIKRWADLTRSMPPAIDVKPDGTHRVSESFSEWMMGWPETYITRFNFRRSDALRLIGNGVVTRQAEAAIKTLINTGTATP